MFWMQKGCKVTKTKVHAKLTDSILQKTLLLNRLKHLVCNALVLTNTFP